MRSDTCNWHYYGGYTEITDLSSNVYSTDEDESKCIIVHKRLSQSCSMNEGESESSIVNETLSHNDSADVDELCSKEKDILEYIIEQKDAEYKESSVTKEGAGYFKIFECGQNLLDILDVKYERACMSTPKDKYYTTLLETLVDDNNRNGALFSNEKLQRVVGKVMEETEAEFECRNKITMDTSYQSPIQKKYISTINNSAYYELDDQVDTISDFKEQVDPSSYPRIDTHITDRIKKL